VSARASTLFVAALAQLLHTCRYLEHRRRQDTRCIVCSRSRCGQMHTIQVRRYMYPQRVRERHTLRSSSRAGVPAHTAAGHYHCAARAAWTRLHEHAQSCSRRANSSPGRCLAAAHHAASLHAKYGRAVGLTRGRPCRRPAGSSRSLRTPTPCCRAGRRCGFYASAGCSPGGRRGRNSPRQC
jgi:hypothetical protein